jgi:hypothetical protein
MKMEATQGMNHDTKKKERKKRAVSCFCQLLL